MLRVEWPNHFPFQRFEDPNFGSHLHISYISIASCVTDFPDRGGDFWSTSCLFRRNNAATVFGVALCISLFCCDDLWDWKVRTSSYACYIHIFESAPCATFVFMSPSHEQDSLAKGGNWTFVVFAYGLIIHQSFQKLILTTSKTSSMSLHTDMFWVISPQYSYSPYPRSLIVLRYSDLHVLILNRPFLF